jgi:hypothetical protein
VELLLAIIVVSVVTGARAGSTRGLPATRLVLMVLAVVAAGYLFRRVI